MKKITVLLVILCVVIGTTAMANIASYPVYEQEGVVNICCTLSHPVTGDKVDLIFAYDRINEEKAFVFLLDLVNGFDPSIEDYMLGFMLDTGPQFFPLSHDLVEDDGKVMFIQIDKKSLLNFLYEIEKNNNRHLSVVLRSATTEDRSWILFTNQIPDTINH